MSDLHHQIRVAFSSHTSELTGAAMSFYTLLTGLDSQLYQCFPLLPDKGPMFKQLGDNGYDPQAIDFTGWGKLTAVKKVTKLLRDQNIDLVYLSCAHKFSRMVGKAAHSLSIPIVWHVREPPKGNRVQKSVPHMKKFKAEVVVVSREQEVELAKKISVIKVDNGVDTARFSPEINMQEARRKFTLGEDDFVFGIVGTIEKRKNTENFLLAAKEIANKYENARFLVIGSGGRDYVEKMHEIVKSSPALEKSVSFTGNIWNIPEAMSALDVLVMPSNWEAFPRVVIEGMTMGKVVIATDVGDVNYMIDHGKNGFVVPPRDLAALKKAMIEMLRNREQLHSIAAHARQKAMKKFTQEIHVENMQKVFQRALSVRRNES